jgi:hypothetical protein
MTKKLKRIAPLQLGIVAGIGYALLSLIIVPIFLLIAVISALVPHQDSSGGAMQAGLGIGMAVLFAVLAPILYGIMGFIIGALAGLIYNLVARWTGGIEYISE